MARQNHCGIIYAAYIKKKHSTAKHEESVSKKAKLDKKNQSKDIYVLNNRQAFQGNELCQSNAEPEKLAPAQCSSKNLSQPLDRFFGPARQVPAIDRLIFSWLADATLPYAILDNEQFRRLIEAVNVLPYKYALPHEGKIRLSVGPNTKNALEWKLKKIIQNEVEYYCFDTDMWTSPAHHSYLSFIIHFIDSKWNRKMLVLSCKPMKAKHTAENISNELDVIRQDWGLLKENLHLALRDSGANMVAAMRLGQVDDANCFLHLLNLIVSKGITEQRTVKDLITRASNISHDFTHKSEFKRVLHDSFVMRNQKPLNMVQSQPTRWNSVYLMLKRIVNIKEVLVGAIAILECSGNNLSNRKLTTNDWQLIHPVRNVIVVV